MDSKQLDLDGNEVGNPYKVSITEKLKTTSNRDGADGVTSTAGDKTDYTVRAQEFSEAIGKALAVHSDKANDDADEWTVKAKRG